MNKLTRPLYLLLGAISVLLGAVGIAIPVLPTTPFLIVAVWAFSKSSPALADKIRQHKLVGPYIVDWEAHGVIPIKAKFFAWIMMAFSATSLVWSGRFPVWLSVIVCAAMSLIGIYIFSKPSQRPE